MRLTEELVAVCPDCAAEFPVRSVHSCVWQAHRYAVDLMDSLIRNTESGVGLLWLYRIAYRVRQKGNKLEKYADRAAMARRVCELNNRESIRKKKIPGNTH